MASAPVALGIGGVATVLLISGIQGKSVESIIQGDFGSAPDPKGPTGSGEPLNETGSKEGGGAVPQGGSEGQPTTFDGHPVAPWIAPILQYARRMGWKGHVVSGYRSLAEQTRIFNSGVRPAAKPGTSNHEKLKYPGGAVDVTSPQELSTILLHSQYATVLVYAGAKDPVHFSHPHNGSY
jgi:hypothetical protein